MLIQTYDISINSVSILYQLSISYNKVITYQDMEVIIKKLWSNNANANAHPFSEHYSLIPYRTWVAYGCWRHSVSTALGDVGCYHRYHILNSKLQIQLSMLCRTGLFWPPSRCGRWLYFRRRSFRTWDGRDWWTHGGMEWDGLGWDGGRWESRRWRRLETETEKKNGKREKDFIDWNAGNAGNAGVPSGIRYHIMVQLQYYVHTLIYIMLMIVRCRLLHAAYPYPYRYQYQYHLQSSTTTNHHQHQNTTTMTAPPNPTPADLTSDFFWHRLLSVICVLCSPCSIVFSELLTAFTVQVQ